jgi:hypothetical protein
MTTHLETKIFENDVYDNIPDHVQMLVRDGNLFMLRTEIPPTTAMDGFAIKKLIFFAIFCHQFEIVKYMVDHRQNLFQDRRDIFFIVGEALERAAFYGAHDIVCYLMEEQDADRDHLYFPILYAVRNGYLPIVEYLISKVIDRIFHHNENDFLCAACANNRQDIVRYFVEQRHLDIHQNNESALKVAVHSLSFSCVQYLVEECGADIHCLQGRIFYECVASYNGMEMNNNIVNKCQKTLEKDTKRGQFIEYFVEQGAEINFDRLPIHERVFFQDRRDILFEQLTNQNVAFFCILVKTGGLDFATLRDFMNQYDEQEHERSNGFTTPTATAAMLLEEIQHNLVDYILYTYLPLSNALGDSKHDIPGNPGLSTVLFDHEFNGLRQRPEMEFLRLTLAVLHGWDPITQELSSVGVFVRLTRILKQISLNTFTRRRQRQMAKVQTSKAFIKEKQDEFVRRQNTPDL